MLESPLPYSSAAARALSKVDLTRDQVIAMAGAISLRIPESDLENVRLRLSALLTEMEVIERELGPEMDAVDPVPPVFPREDFEHRSRSGLRGYADLIALLSSLATFCVLCVEALGFFRR